MRGRVMALWAVAFLGSTPIGGPIAGAVSERFGGRAGLALGAARLPGGRGRRRGGAAPVAWRGGRLRTGR